MAAQGGRKLSAEEARRMVISRFNGDPRMSIASHQAVVEKFRSERARVTLPYYSWEQPGAHTYSPREAMK